MKDSTDEQLLAQIKSGNEVAETTLFQRYKDLVVKISRGYFIIGGELEDLIQEGMIGLYKAVKYFNSTKEASFKTFAVLCIKRQIQTAIRHANANKSKSLSSAISLNTFFRNNVEESSEFFPIQLVFDINMYDKIFEKEEYSSLINTIQQTLSKMEFAVLKLYLQGYSYKEISAQLNVSEKSIDNSLSRIKTKLKAKLSQQK